MIELFLILLVASLLFGYWQAKKNNTILLGNNIASSGSEENICITNPYKDLRDSTPSFFINKNMTPKEYGMRYGNGKSRIKKTNRLRFSK